MHLTSKEKKDIKERKEKSGHFKEMSQETQDVRITRSRSTSAKKSPRVELDSIDSTSSKDEVFLTAKNEQKTQSSRKKRSKKKRSKQQKDIKEGDMEPQNSEVEVPLFDPNKKEITNQDWINVFTNLNATLKSTQHDLKGVKGKTETYSDKWKQEIAANNVAISEKIIDQEYKINLLTNIVIRQDERIKMLEEKMTNNYVKEIRPNLLIHGILEDKDEDHDKLRGLVSDFFKVKMEITEEINIKKVRRLGSTRTRPILVRLTNIEDKSIIFSNASNLKGKRNAKKKLLFIQYDMANFQTEIKDYYRELKKENNKKDDELKKTIKI